MKWFDPACAASALDTSISLNSPPPPPEQLSAWASELGSELAAIERMDKLCSRALRFCITFNLCMMAAAVYFVAAAGADAYPGHRPLIAFIAAGCVVAAITGLLLGEKLSLREAKNCGMQLGLKAKLSALEPIRLQDCPEALTCCLTDQLCCAYQHQVVGLGRQLLRGEVAAMLDLLEQKSKKIEREQRKAAEERAQQLLQEKVSRP